MEENLLQILESENGPLSDEQIRVLESLSSDADPFVRDMIATRLVYSVNETSKRVLFQLARDTNELVRTDAYDSLAVFPDADVLCFLDEATCIEQEEVARSYAILSWADVSILVSADSASQIQKAYFRKANEESARCALSWCYALYKMGEEKTLDEMLLFLNHEDYRIRCTTLSLLSEMANAKNETKLKGAVEGMLSKESVLAVLNSAKRFLSNSFSDL